MTAPLLLNLVVEPDWTADTRVTLTVDGQPQPVEVPLDHAAGLGRLAPGAASFAPMGCAGATVRAKGTGASP